MNGKLPAALGALLLLVWAGLFGALGRRSDEPAASPARPPLPATHTVTPQQLTASGSLAARPLGSFTAPAHDGRRVAWPDFAADRPAVVVFVKQG
jgi:hypothetical protein